MQLAVLLGLGLLLLLLFNGSGLKEGYYPWWRQRLPWWRRNWQAGPYWGGRPYWGRRNYGYGYYPYYSYY